MYDKLVRALRVEPFEVESAGLAKVMHEAADAIEELCGLCASLSKDCSEAVAKYLELWEKQPRWIPVTEEPPLKVGDDGYNGYLVYANGYYEVADYTTEFDNAPYFYADGEYEPNVRYFMPLPEPPKEES